MDNAIPYIFNGESIQISKIPLLEIVEWRNAILPLIADGAHLSALFAAKHGDELRLYAIVSVPERRQVCIIATQAESTYPALTPDCPSAHWFEREIFEQWNILPEGHPWLKPIRFQPVAQTGQQPQIGVTDFFGMEGEEVHEVAVGPVHAGVIEPGHFRFQCHGETVYHLEISLGYQHRGVERALAGGPDSRSLHYIETLAGDTTAGHAGAYCMAIEALSGTQVPPHAETIRAIAAELERIANHTGDLGGMATDVAFLPTANYCGRIRGDVLNLTALVCGNRFGRNLFIPGGVRFDIESQRRDTLLKRLDGIEKDLNSAVPLMFETPSVLTRFDGTGKLSSETARKIGLVGVAARACGIGMDVRSRMPYGAYQQNCPPASTYQSGDCFARAYVRWLEITQSIEFVRHQLEICDSGNEYFSPCENLEPDSFTVSLTEGWRGEICHVAASDSRGAFAFYKITDPSFHNWFGLAMALRSQQISDFPLCNKSFSLSYCGHDL